MNCGRRKMDHVPAVRGEHGSEGSGYEDPDHHEERDEG
jgi:hypothetical protein